MVLSASLTYLRDYSAECTRRKKCEEVGGGEFGGESIEKLDWTRYGLNSLRA